MCSVDGTEIPGLCWQGLLVHAHRRCNEVELLSESVRKYRGRCSVLTRIFFRSPFHHNRRPITLYRGYDN